MNQQQYPQYGANPWGSQYPQQNPQPQFYAPPNQAANQQPAMGGQPAASFGMDPFLTGVAGDVLRQQGQTYLQRSQAFMEQKMGWLSGGMIQYLFNVDPAYVQTKMLMLIAPFLKKWTYTRVLEQISGGHKYLPPRRDVNAPDLYIPVMALWTYCILIGVALFTGRTFKPEIIYNTVSSALMAWTVHAIILKIILWMVGIPSAVPLLELMAYAGYTFAAASAALIAHLASGGMTYHVVWAYSSLCMAVFLVRSMKRVFYQEANHYSPHSSKINYLLLGLALFQFPFIAWLARVPTAGGAVGYVINAAASNINIQNGNAFLG